MSLHNYSSVYLKFHPSTAETKNQISWFKKWL